MAAEFLPAYNITRQNEGGYHNATGVNSADRGGETFKGIARKAWPGWLGWKIIDAMKIGPGFPQVALEDETLSKLVRGFYQRHFWDINRLTEISNQAIANELFDTGVNVGSVTAARWLQRACNYLNRNQRSWPNLKVDGMIGPITLSRVNALSAVDQRHLFDVLNIMQGMHYLNIIDRDPSQEVFLRGWISRVELIR